MSWDQQELFSGILAEFAECPCRSAQHDAVAESWRVHYAARSSAVTRYFARKRAEGCPRTRENARRASARAYLRLKADPEKLAARREKLRARASGVGQPRGESHPRHKLTWSQVAHIRAAHAAGASANALALSVGVAPSLVSRIVRGLAWVGPGQILTNGKEMGEIARQETVFP